MNTLSRDLMKELECPVCLRYMIPPVILCSNGHSICNTCRKRVGECPTCRGSFINYRSMVLENIIRGLNYPCSNSAEGCDEILPLDLINDHETVCPMGKHDCAMNKFPGIRCDWKGYWEDFKEHMRTCHDTHAIVEESCFTSEATSTVMPVIFTLGEIFLYYKLKENTKWFFAVMLVGTPKEAANFKCRFTLQAKNGIDAITKCQVVPSFTDKFEDVFRSYRCLKLDVEEVNDFIYNHKLNLEVEITEIEK